MDGFAYSKAFSDMVMILVILCCIFVPLGLWKLVELIIWCVNNIKVNIG